MRPDAKRCGARVPEIRGAAVVAAMLPLAACATGTAMSGQGVRARAPVTFVAMGDMPYRAADVAPFEA